MKEYTVEIFAESYNSYVVKADSSDRAIMEAISDFLKENDTESMITIKSVKIMTKKQKMRSNILITSKQ